MTNETILPADEAAIVSNKEGGIDILLPPDREDLPEHMVFMVACAMRYHDDPAFVMEQIEWLNGVTEQIRGRLQ